MPIQYITGADCPAILSPRIGVYVIEALEGQPVLVKRYWYRVIKARKSYGVRV